jgi:hypothetical protein
MVTNRGRPSADSLSAPQFQPSRLQPSPQLTGRARDVFVALVASATPQHFQEIDRPLIALYATMVAQAEAASAEIAKDMAGASPALLEAQRQAVRGAHDLAMRLRCSPQARMGHTNPRTRRASPLSYYDTQKLGGSA